MELHVCHLGEIEYREGVVRGEPVTLVTADDDEGFLQWWVVDGQVRSSTRVTGLGVQSTV